MIDPRSSVFEKRLTPVSKIIAIGGGKGGVGKTTVTCLLALQAAKAGKRIGLLDLDVHGGAAHIVLGIEPEFPDEEGGILPLLGPMGIRFMSATAFSADKPLPLRGFEVTDAIAELLAVTIWPELDLLLIDFPPGLGESFLDSLRFMPRASIITVTTESPLSLAIADRFLSAIPEPARIAGMITNMVQEPGPGRDAGEPRPASDAVAKRHGTEVLATVPRDAALENAPGNVDLLCASDAALALGGLAAVL